MSEALPLTPLSKLPNFDPRKNLVFGLDGHLPAVSQDRLQPEALRQRFVMPPAWTPEVMAERRYTDRSPKHASVLLALVMRERLTVLLTQRTSHLSTHAGQIAFPGGKADEDDMDACATALREAQEEVGLKQEYVQVLGALPTYMTGTAFIITPVVALVQPGFSLALNANEVVDAFEVPLDFLMNPLNHQRHAMESQGLQREWFSMPYQDAATERFIWGATAGMLRNFYRFLLA